jgi:hypothetical protein
MIHWLGLAKGGRSETGRVSVQAAVTPAVAGDRPDAAADRGHGGRTVGAEQMLGWSELDRLGESLDWLLTPAIKKPAPHFG